MSAANSALGRVRPSPPAEQTCLMGCWAKTRTGSCHRHNTFRLGKPIFLFCYPGIRQKLICSHEHFAPTLVVCRHLQELQDSRRLQPRGDHAKTPRTRVDILLRQMGHHCHSKTTTDMDHQLSVLWGWGKINMSGSDI